MARKFKLIFLLSFALLMVFGTTSFARAEMTSGDADLILDYYYENLDTMFQSKTLYNTIKTNLEQVDRQAFADTFNNYFYNINGFADIYNGEYDFNNISCFPYYYTYGPSNNPQYYIYFYFVLSNNTFSNDLNYLYYETKTNDTTVNKIGFGGWNGTEIKTLPALEIQLNRGRTIASSQVVNLDIYSSTVYTSDFPQIDGSKVDIKNLLGLSPVQTVYYKPYGATEPTAYLLANTIDLRKNLPEIPDTPESGDTGESGDIGGGGTGGGTTTPDYSEDLDNIQSGITDINNNIGETNDKLDNISGELSNINNNLTTVPDMSDTTITNEDITSNLDFEFEQDPYTNFWLELTTGLSNSFTNSKREISIQFRDKTHVISLENFSVQIPSALKPFLTIISTVFITWKMLQYIKIIIDNISSGNIDEVLEMNEEEGITNLF